MFFNKTHWVLIRLSDQTLVKPDEEFSINIALFDGVSFESPSTPTSSIQKLVGRNKTNLTTLVSITQTDLTRFNLSGTISSTEWNGIDSISLVINILDEQLSIPLVVSS